jgi:hypothetical protein
MLKYWPFGTILFGGLLLELQAGKLMLGLMGDKKFKEIDYK